MILDKIQQNLILSDFYSNEKQGTRNKEASMGFHSWNNVISDANQNDHSDQNDWNRSWVNGEEDNQNPWNGPIDFDEPLSNEFGFLPWAVIDIIWDDVEETMIIRGLMRNGKRVQVNITSYGRWPYRLSLSSEGTFVVAIKENKFLMFEVTMGTLICRNDPINQITIDFPSIRNRYLTEHGFTGNGQQAVIYQILCGVFAPL